MQIKWKQEQSILNKAPIIKVPLQFHFEPVEILSKELTKLNSPYLYRILYLGPRWENSSLTHQKFSRKHGYTFNEKQINTNSTFFTESMSQNEFYRNQVYYRAFEGMNPTIQKEEELLFDSRFESGNLDCVVKISDEEYDLFLRIDSNTKGHIFWFNFEIGNGRAGKVVKLNICNLTKSKSLYEKGFKPYSCVKSENGQFLNWTQDKIDNIRIQQKKLRYDFIYQKIKVRTLYQLSFSYQFTSSNTVRFAYCIPYTYTNLLKQINELGTNASVGSIGKSLTGIDIPIVKIGNFDQTMEKPVLFIMGRVHPGESNGSIVLSGFMKHLCFSQEASYLRKKIVTLIVPMINPDGVILGNSRTGAAGKDLNRQFKTKNRNLFPQVNLIKKIVWTIQETHDIQIFLDFHGHSRKKNMFCFGPNYNLTQPEYYKARVIPKYLSQLTSIFRYFGCTYTIPSCKSTTARAVMLNEVGIPLVYTIETSVGIYYDYQSHKDLFFTQAKWEEIGINICKALRQYFQSLEQYEEYLKVRNMEQEMYRKGKIEKEKGEKMEKNEKAKVKETKVKRIAAKDVKLIKLFEEIKASEMNNLNRKKEDQSDDSDSQNDEDNLEKMKMAEFEGMVTQCIDVQIKRKEETDKLLGKNIVKSPENVKRNIRKRKTKLFSKEELTIGSQVNMVERQTKVKNEEIFVFRNEKKNRKGNSLEYGHMRRGENEEEKREQKIIEKSHRNIQYQSLISNNQFFELDQKEENHNPAKNRSNLRMFNFSKMVDEQKSRNIMTSGRYRQESDISKPNHLTFIKKQQISTPSSIKAPDKKYFNLSLEHNLEMVEDGQMNQLVRGEKKKVKGVFPAPFYRIKYQNYQKKKLKSLEYNRREEETESESKGTERKKKRNDILFLKIKKFQP